MENENNGKTGSENAHIIGDVGSSNPMPNFFEEFTEKEETKKDENTIEAKAETAGETESTETKEPEKQLSNFEEDDVEIDTKAESTDEGWFKKLFKKDEDKDADSDTEDTQRVDGEKEDRIADFKYKVGSTVKDFHPMAKKLAKNDLASHRFLRNLQQEAESGKTLRSIVGSYKEAKSMKDELDHLRRENGEINEKYLPFWRDLSDLRNKSNEHFTYIGNYLETSGISPDKLKEYIEYEYKKHFELDDDAKKQLQEVEAKYHENMKTKEQNEAYKNLYATQQQYQQAQQANQQQKQKAIENYRNLLNMPGVKDVVKQFNNLKGDSYGFIKELANLQKIHGQGLDMKTAFTHIKGEIDKMEAVKTLQSNKAAKKSNVPNVPSTTGDAGGALDLPNIKSSGDFPFASFLSGKV